MADDVAGIPMGDHHHRTPDHPASQSRDHRTRWDDDDPRIETHRRDDRAVPVHAQDERGDRRSTRHGRTTARVRNGR